MDLITARNYREYIKWRLSQLPSAEAELQNVAQETQIHTSQLSEFLRGKREPTPDQAFKLGRFLKLDDGEMGLLLDLVALERAKEPQLRNYLKSRIRRARGQLSGDSESFRAQDSAYDSA